jgi:hypothetical protein
MFPDLTIWANHPCTEHRFGPDWSDQRCPLCLQEMGHGKDSISRHIGGHLEEIALAVLPPVKDEEYDATVSSKTELETIITELTHADEDLALMYLIRLRGGETVEEILSAVTVRANSQNNLESAHTTHEVLGNFLNELKCGDEDLALSWLVRLRAGETILHILKADVDEKYVRVSLASQAYGAERVGPWQERLSEHCAVRGMNPPIYRTASDRRGGRTAWSCAIEVGGLSIPARFWYDGQYVHNAREDAAEMALRKLHIEDKTEIATGPYGTLQYGGLPLNPAPFGLS